MAFVKRPNAFEGNHADIIAVVRSSTVRNLLAVESSREDGEEGNEDKIPQLKVIPLEDGSLPSSLEEAYTARYRPPIEANGANPNVHVIVSVVSGTGLAKPFYSSLLSMVLTSLSMVLDADYAVHYTRSPDTITELTESTFLPTANKGIRQRIILLSGDGGVVDIINALFSDARSAQYVAPQVVLIPMGTGNALAHSSGITKDNTFGLSSLARGTPKSLPLFKSIFSAGSRLVADEGRSEEELPLKDEHGNPVVYGAVVTSWGLHAGLVADSDTAEYRRYGVQRFGMAAKEALNPTDGKLPHAYRGRVSVLSEDGTWRHLDRTEHAYILAALVSSLEKNFMISPESKPLAGDLRLVHFGSMPGDEIMRIMTLAYQQGGHVKESEVGYEAIEGVRIEFNEEDGKWRRICVDGKIIRVEQDGWVEVRRERVSVLDILTLDN